MSESASNSRSHDSDAAHLREMLRQVGLSQRGAARQMGINERTMRRYCLGELPVPRLVWLAMTALTDKQLCDLPRW